MTDFSFFSQSNGNDIAAGAAAGGFMIFSLLFWVIIMGLIVTAIVFWVISLIHVLQHQDVKDRVTWIVILLVVGNIAGFIYYFAVKRPYDLGGMRDPSVQPK